MLPIRPASTSVTEQTNAEKMRSEARRFVTALTDRLGELENMAQLARKFNVFSANEYAEFKQLFLNFRDLCEEFQTLSRMAETSLANIDHRDQRGHSEAVALDAIFHDLQIPMLQAMIRTNLRLLRVWDDRLRVGEGLPFGTRELFQETVRIIDIARNELLRPRYLALLEQDSLDDAEQADRLLKALIKKTPSLFNFVGNMAVDEELMRLINGLPRH
jgi:hypothetical protein